MPDPALDDVRSAFKALADEHARLGFGIHLRPCHALRRIRPLYDVAIKAMELAGAVDPDMILIAAGMKAMQEAARHVCPRDEPTPAP